MEWADADWVTAGAAVLAAILGAAIGAGLAHRSHRRQAARQLRAPVYAAFGAAMDTFERAATQYAAVLASIDTSGGLLHMGKGPYDVLSDMDRSMSDARRTAELSWFELQMFGGEPVAAAGETWRNTVETVTPPPLAAAPMAQRIGVDPQARWKDHEPERRAARGGFETWARADLARPLRWQAGSLRRPHAAGERSTV